MQMHEPEYCEALEACREGRFTEDLRDLYQMPARERVPWVLLPDWHSPPIPWREGTKGEASSSERPSS